MTKKDADKISGAIENLTEVVRNLPRHLFFQPVPHEVIDLWLEGKYAGGLSPSVAYDQLGWALMVRGFYRYKVTERKKKAPAQKKKAIPRKKKAPAKNVKTGDKAKLIHRGYCVIDLNDGEICFKGIRLESPGWEFENEYHPLLWKSDASAIRQPSSGRKKHARLTCAYRLLNVDHHRNDLEVSEVLKAFASISDPRDSEKEVSMAIPYLALHFDQDWQRILDVVRLAEVNGPETISVPAVPEAIFAGFTVTVDAPDTPEADKVELIGDYSTFGEHNLSGSVTFQRIDHAIL